MTAHELARKLLEMPDIDVRVYDQHWYEYDPITMVIPCIANVHNFGAAKIDHEFIGISS